MIYEFAVNGSVLGGKDLGAVHIHEVHNSPYKVYSGSTSVAVPNNATVKGASEVGNVVVSDSDNATVIVTATWGWGPQ
jgi:hypothetical protein